MDAATQRHPYRCLPLVIANQCGWVLRNPTGFRAYWYGGPSRTDMELRFDSPENRIVSHFGSGVVTFTIPNNATFGTGTYIVVVDGTDVVSGTYTVSATTP